jgi:cell division septation protein DedD
LRPTFLVKNEKGAMVWVVLALLAFVVIAAVLVMQLMFGASKPSPAPAPAVVKMKVPPMPKAEPKKAEALQPPPEKEGQVESPPEQTHDNSTPAEPNAPSPAPPSSAVKAAGVAGTASAQPAVTVKPEPKSSLANAGAPTADAAAPAQKNTENGPAQETSADNAKSEQTATPGVAKTIPPGAASKPASDHMKTEATAVAAAKVSKPPANQGLSKPTATATAPEKEALFTVQVGAFHHKAYADARLQKLKGLGYPAYIFRLMGKKQRPLYLVCFGRFQTLAEASGAMAAFKEKEKMPAAVARPGS